MKTFISGIIKVFGSIWKAVSAMFAKSERNQLSPAARSVGALVRQNPIKSVGTKLFLIFFISILFFVSVVGVTSLKISESVIEAKVSESSRQTIVQAVEKLDLIFNGYEQMTLQLVADTEFTDAVAQLSQMDRTKYEFIETRQIVENKLLAYTLDKTIFSVSVLNVNGETLWNSGTPNAKTVKDDDWFKQTVEAGGAPRWFGTRLNGYFDIPNANSFIISRGLKDRRSNNLTAIFVIEVKAEALANQLANVKMGETGMKYVIDENNLVVQSEQRELWGQPFGIQLQKDNETGIFSTELDGNEQLVIFHPSAKTGWYLVGTVPLGELLKETNQILWVTIAVVIVATIFAVIAGYVVVRMIALPLKKLAELMKEGERGNLSVRSENKRSDEIGQLSQSFNQMMEQITNLVRQTSDSAQEVLKTAVELSDASKKTAMSAKEIAVATDEIANGATSLAVEAEKGNDITHTLGTQMRSVVEVNHQMESSASQVQKASEQGTGYMSELITKTNATEEMTRSMIEKVDKLKESTSSIRKILDVLNNITKQTNILSLNATIEAARAGAAGKGFMVVADEIRKLADQSKQSIDFVAQITETIQSEIDETVSVLSTAYPIFQEQISSVKEADTIFKQVQSHMDDFIGKLTDVSSSIHQLDQSQAVLSEAMSNVSAVAEQSSATSEEVASLSSEQTNISDGLVRLAEKLEELSNSLKESLSQFKI